ncbi:MAG: phosphoribosylaminoimidazolesuccinocarboxamide synthase [Planctomycetia bacterium]|nr:MAG: phosphoribosylaminoimidazolesuccinocarboxamide synthase [Planctomycetia bacterium]
MISHDPSAVERTELTGLVARGKVRDIYAAGDDLLIVATDRISAFDVVMSRPVPGKGVLLTQMSRFWLESLPACRPHHLIYVVDGSRIPPGFESHAALLTGRAQCVRRALVLPVECVARGYLVGGGWKEYQADGRISGVALPAGMRLAERLAQPIFTPSTKAASGHDEPISFEQAVQAAERFAIEAGFDAATGRRWMHEARDRTLAIYAAAARHALARGVIVADTKFEFGVADGELLLVDEVLTPDSSRFWPADLYEIGRNPPSYDKQFLRDYLESIPWNKQPPPPPIPDDVIARTRAKYIEAFERLTGLRAADVLRRGCA